MRNLTLLLVFLCPLFLAGLTRVVPADKQITECRRILGPSGLLVTGYQRESVWRTPVPVTITQMWCETDAGTAGFDFNVDDGTPAGVNGSDISCSASPGVEDSILSGDTTMGAGDRLDMDVGTVSGASRLEICWTYTLN